MFLLCAPVLVLAFNPADSHTDTQYSMYTSCHSHTIDTNMQYSGLSLLGRPKHWALQTNSRPVSELLFLMQTPNTGNDIFVCIFCAFQSSHLYVRCKQYPEVMPTKKRGTPLLLLVFPHAIIFV